MKKNLLVILLFLAVADVVSQNSSPDGSRPTVKKEKVLFARSVSEVTPGLWDHMILPYGERKMIDRLKVTDFSLAPYQNDYKEYYDRFIDYVSVEISATCNGERLVSQSTGDKLSSGQKNILNAADLGSDIFIKIRYRYKHQGSVSTGSSGRILEGFITVPVVPAIEAEYPGGLAQVKEYLVSAVFNKIPKTGIPEKVRNAVVKFTIDEGGQITDAKISRTSADPVIDRLLLDSLGKMSGWSPAKNSKGIKVKQEFRIPLGGDGC